MSPSAPTRRLSAVLMADVVGYSRLMGEDEEATVATLGDYRGVFTQTIAEAGGRVVDAKGDALLAEFGSMTDALGCAVAIQREIAVRNGRLPAARRMQFRIGLNLGEVLVRGDEIYGDDVNIAARLESLADPGGICLSRSAYDRVAGRLELRCEYLGEQRVKNIPDPVRAYRVVLDAEVSADDIPPTEARPRPSPDGGADAPTFELPDRPSIAVLPFENMSGDADQEYFADGIAEDLITGLSRLRNLFVIARNSSFVYKGRAVDVRQVGRELGVRHVLEGSVRKAGNRVRITAQLIEAATGTHVWAERYDRELKDIFDLQDDITRAIISELNVSLLSGESGRIRRSSTRSPEAYDRFLAGNQDEQKFDRAANLRAREAYEEALRIDPDFAAAHVGLGWTHYHDASGGWTPSRSASGRLALQEAERALELVENYGEAHALRGTTRFLFGDFDGGIAELEQGVRDSPSNSQCMILLAHFLSYVGHAERGLKLAERALRLDPYPTDWHLMALGNAHLNLGQTDRAIEIFRLCVERVPQYVNVRLTLLEAHLKAEQEDEAANLAAQIVELNPGIDPRAYVPSTRPEMLARIQRLLDKARGG